jgi:hypothetical protein
MNQRKSPPPVTLEGRMKFNWDRFYLWINPQGCLEEKSLGWYQNLPDPQPPLKGRQNPAHLVPFFKVWGDRVLCLRLTFQTPSKEIISRYFILWQINTLRCWGVSGNYRSGSVISAPIQWLRPTSGRRNPVYPRRVALNIAGSSSSLDVN